MTQTIFFPTLDLQLFADAGAAGGTQAAGATGAAGSDAGSQTGENAQDAAAHANVPDRRAEFERLKNDYKDLFSEWAEDTIKKRNKNIKEKAERYEKAAPLFDTLSRKHGVEADDIEGLMKAVDEDDYYFEDEALARGVSVPELKQIRKVERENRELTRKLEEANRAAGEEEARRQTARIISEWNEQAERTKQIYPGFDFDEEQKNPKFRDLLRAGVDVESAYMVVHRNEIVPAVMTYAAKAGAQNAVNTIMAQGNRPVENGNRSQGAVQIGVDVSKLSPEQRADYLARARRGERVTFK